MTETLVEHETPETLDILPAAKIRQELTKIREYQAMIQELLIKDLDYGVIPGTQKPSLLKPGAEKIAKALGLVDVYVILDKVEDWDNLFFRYMVKCILKKFGTGFVVSEGLGECNSKESRYQYRWMWPNEVPAGIDKARLKQMKVDTRYGEKTKYRVENEDLASQVNTILKMAKKRALVDAVLSAGRLSAIFTQDMEDMEPPSSPQGQTTPPAGDGKKKSGNGSKQGEKGKQTPLPTSLGKSEEPKQPLPVAGSGHRANGANNIAPAQVSAINSIVANKNLPEDAVNGFLSQYGKSSIEDLSYDEAKDLLMVIQMLATPGQIKMFWVVAKEAGITNEEQAHALIEEKTGKKSLKLLTREEIENIIKELQAQAIPK